MGLLDWAAPDGQQQPGMIDPAAAQRAGVYEGLLRLGAGIAQAGAPVPAGHARPGWGQAVSGGLAGFSSGMREGRQGYMQQQAQDQELARQQAINEAVNAQPGAQLSPGGQRVAGLLGNIPANARSALSLLGPQQQQAALATMLTQRQVQQLSPEQVAAMGLPAGTIVQRGTDGKLDVTARPRSEEDRLRVAQAGGTRVSVNTALPPQENAFAQTTGKALGEEAGATLAAGRTAADQMRRLTHFEQLLDRSRTGAGAGALLTVGQYAQQFGIPDNMLPAGMKKDEVASAEGLRALSNQMVLGMIGTGGMPANNFSDADRSFLAQAAPSLALTPEGNRTLIEVGRLGAQRNLEVARSWREFSMHNGNNAESYQRWSSQELPKVTERDLFSQLQTRAPNPNAPASPPPQPAAPQPVGTGGLPRISSPADAARLAPGTRFVDPDGIVRTVPRERLRP